MLLSLAPWPMILFIATLGLLLSIGLRTVLRANLVMVMAPLLLMWCSSISFESFSFSMTLRRQTIDNYLGMACVQEVVYLIAAYVCWKIALVLFENRASLTDSV